MYVCCVYIDLCQWRRRRKLVSMIHFITPFLRAAEALKTETTNSRRSTRNKELLCLELTRRKGEKKEKKRNKNGSRGEEKEPELTTNGKFHLCILQVEIFRMEESAAKFTESQVSISARETQPVQQMDGLQTNISLIVVG